MISVDIPSDEEKHVNDKSKRRERKGKNAGRHVENYSVIDLETTGIFVSSARIVEISAIKVRNNQVVGEFTSLVNPLCHIPEEATKINHITDEMVKNAPTLEKVINEFLQFIGDDIILGYNNAGFDMNIIYDAVEKILRRAFENDYIDILHVARRNVDGLENYKLKTVCDYYGIGTEGAHRALKDCYLTKECYDNLYNEYGNSAFSRHNNVNGYCTLYSTKTLALRELQKILSNILCDGTITLEEVDVLRFWLEEHRELSAIYPFGKVIEMLDDVLEDGQISPLERSTLESVFSEIVDPVKSQSCNERITSLVAKHVCLTGDFDFGSKEDVAEIIEKAGGIVDKAVKKATNYVVVGARGSESWKTGNYGGKIQKAMEYNSKGMNIKVVEEKKFIPMAVWCMENHEKQKEDLPDWKQSVREMLEKMILEKELPKQSLHLMTNYTRDKKQISSYSICIFEPDYPLLSDTHTDPARNSIVLNIKDKNDKIELLVSKSRFKDIGVPEDAQVNLFKSDNTIIQVVFPLNSYNMLGYIKQIVEYALETYTSKASSFGCCSLFLVCSDAKRCVHENRLYSKACAYRHNLEAGRIFYGKNKTVKD